MSIETIERGDYRARIEHDEFGFDSKPDGDYFGTVYQMEHVSWGARVSTLGTSYTPGDPDLGSAITEGWNRTQDMRIVERYLRLFFGVVGFDYIDRDYGKLINVVTLDDLKTWGFESVEEYRTQTGHDDPSHGCLEEWRAWADGEVYYVVVERKVTTYTQIAATNGDLIREIFGDDWEDTDQTCHGFYSTEAAEEYANSVLPEAEAVAS